MPRLHEEQIELPDGLVRKLVDDQFPQWSNLRLRPLASDGAIHRIDRLGDDYVVRLPFIGWAVDDVDRDAERLPLLATALPVSVPELVGRGAPAAGMPWKWGVYRWLDGRHPTPGEDDATLAPALVDAVLALRAMPAIGVRTPSTFEAAAVDDKTRPRVVSLGSKAALAAWDAAVMLQRDPDPTSGWVHGDFMPGNLLMEGRKLTGIIDWGASGIGDAALDLLAAWTCLGPRGRAHFLGALDATPAQIARARALAVNKVAWGLQYYRDTNPGFAAVLAFTLSQVENDWDE